jgi:hypothetical protein
VRRFELVRNGASTLEHQRGSRLLTGGSEWKFNLDSPGHASDPGGTASARVARRRPAHVDASEGGHVGGDPIGPKAFTARWAEWPLAVTAYGSHARAPKRFGTGGCLPDSEQRVVASQVTESDVLCDCVEPIPSDDESPRSLSGWRDHRCLVGEGSSTLNDGVLEGGVRVLCKGQEPA